MKEISRSNVYKKWLRKLKDVEARTRILTRVARLAEGNPGKSRFLGDISELIIDYGPGYRIYYKDTVKEIIILLCGGNKSTQQQDIEKARRILRHYKEE
jgi:putative addiction module killer protein